VPFAKYGVMLFVIILGGVLMYVQLFAAPSGPVLSQHISISHTTGLRLYQKEPFSGDAVTYYPNGEMAKLAHFEQGLRDGFLKQWFDNGTLAFDSKYRGNMRSESIYLQGKVNGVSLQWYATGELFKKMNYENGLEVGLQQAWRRNGKLYSNYQYINGRVFGLKRANMCVGLEDENVIESD
jgi:hypothetical protein